MERDNLYRDYERTIEKQAVLLKRQQDTIESLQKELSSQQHRLTSVSKHYQIKIESLIQQAQTEALQDISEEIHLLKQELETALKEKELSQTERKRQILELNRLHEEIVALQAGGNTGSLPLDQLGNEYAKVVQALEEETDRLRTEVGKTEEEKLQILKGNVELKKKDHMTSILKNVKGRLKEAQTRVAESVQIAEDALVEKDAALLREKHALNEVHCLESTVSSLTEEAGKKAQVEISKIKDDYNTSIKSMSQEVSRLEMVVNEKQLKCDQILRELRKTTDEAEQLQVEISRRKEQHHQETLDLHDRINSLEAKIVTTSAERDNLSTVNMKSIQECEQQKAELLTRINELEHRLTASRAECAEIRFEYEEMKRNYMHVTAELEELRNDSQNNEKFLKRHLQMKTEEIKELSASNQVRVDASDSSHRNMVAQLYENTAVIQENCSKLQSYISDQRMEYEKRISDLTHQLQESQEKSQQLNKSLHEANTNLTVLKDVTSQYKARITEVEDRLHASERRYAALGQKHHSNGGFDTS
ncbi:uncharacterized protein [Panulirus ornatus]|uniref:uncharacterized protein isoform X4 n=1 Tax=Panulirus ornatus TaxID=150431 RepID=UPI003A86B102